MSVPASLSWARSRWRRLPSVPVVSDLRPAADTDQDGVDRGQIQRSGGDSVFDRLFHCGVVRAGRIVVLSAIGSDTGAAVQAAIMQQAAANAIIARMSLGAVDR
jgi:hypothetical protein